MKTSFPGQTAFLFLSLLFVCTIKLNAQKQTLLNDPFASVKKEFQRVPDSIKPSIYWYWMSDNVSEEGVKKDLGAMAKVGIGRAFIGNIGYPKEEVPYGNVKLFSDAWWRITKTAIATATKKGIDIGMFNAPGWSQTGGPWIKPSKAMRYLTGEELHVKGPQRLSKRIPVKPGFQDVALLAFPLPAGETDQLSNHSPQLSSTASFADITKLADGDTATYSFANLDGKKDSMVMIYLQTSQPFTARSLLLYPAPMPFKADMELQADNGDGFRTLKFFSYDRSNPVLNVGFVPYAPVAISFAAVQAKQFRLVLTNAKGTAGFAEIVISAAPHLERFAEKQLAKMFQTPLPLWNEYQWPQEPEPEKTFTIDTANVFNLSGQLSADGTLNWDVPWGEWVIIRYGMLPTGVTNSPAPPEGTGLEIDKMSKSSLEHHFNSFLGKIQSSLSPAERTSLKWVVADSYETGSQNWTDGMAEIFKATYGYDALPWLPVLSGRVVKTADESNRFLWDLRRLVADRVAYEYVGGLREVSHRHNMKLWLENYGHWGYPSEFLLYGGQTDEIGGEFWNEGTLGNIECKAASSAAHIYGKNKVAAESFTAGGKAYARYPALLKKRGDWSFTEGINATLLHVFITQPYEEKNPGINAGFGTEFNRKNTWFYQGKAFVDYLRRCNYLLQQGRPVNDVAYFIGEDAPKMTGIRYPELPAGYGYDYINADVLLQRATVKDDWLELPGGSRYRLLVLPPQETMRPALLRKIGELINAGLTVLGPAPKRSPSLQNFPAADAEVQQLAAAIWGKVDGKSVTKGRWGKGAVLSGISLQEALDQLSLLPDVGLTGTDVLYAHRTTKDGEIYFLSNQTDQPIRLTPTFRVSGRQPFLWDAVTGATRPLPQYTTTAEMTTVPLQFEPYQSWFVLFSKAAVKVDKNGNSVNFPEPLVLSSINPPWMVTFDSVFRGKTNPIVFKTLIDWSTSEDPAIKNYSGTAIYRTSVQLTSVPAGKTIYLDLGSVKAMAKVRVNGREVGAVWTAPYKVDVTKAIRKGKNQIEVEVVNTWVNRLIGDSRLPVAERKTWTNVNPFTPESKYDPSGLTGPVRLEAVQY